jgi:NADPH-dependent 2,4-dienoyl-CoA reductase/sulfur reductase-like enzyme
VPNLELAELLGCRIENGAVTVDQFQQTSVPHVYAAGETTGIGGLELSLVEGEIAGLAAAGKSDAARRLFGVRANGHGFSRVLDETFALREELRDLVTGDTVVCRCEDVTFEQLRRCGAAVEFLFGWRVESVRPPILPVRVESLLCK